MKRLLLPLLLLAAYPLARLLVFILTPGWLPLRSHSPYMRTEYPDLMAYVAVEEKIDMFLLKIENK